MIKLRPIALSISMLATLSFHAKAQSFSEIGLSAASPAKAMMDINAKVLRNGENIWQRIREGVQMDEVNSSIVRKDEQEFAANPAGLKRSLERSRKYMFYIMSEVERRGMPTEIALLPVIESSYKPGANSPVGASGLWQFMPSTGKNYGLEQTWWYDGRRDVLASTNAALDYLENLHAMFGDWSLALAGYNWGEGNVSRAMQRAQAAGLAPTYENIHMPNETRSYVPKLLAVRNVLLNPEKYGLNLDKLPYKPYFKAISVKRHMDIDLAAKLAGVPLDEFKQLNPAFNLPVFAYKSGRKMLIPTNRVAKFKHNLSQLGNKPLMNWAVYMPNNKILVSDVAGKYNMSASQLKSVNHVTGDMLYAGRPILVALNKDKTSIENNIISAKYIQENDSNYIVKNNSEQKNDIVEAVNKTNKIDMNLISAKYTKKAESSYIAKNNSEQKNDVIEAVNKTNKIDMKLDMPTSRDIAKNKESNDNIQANDAIALFAKNNSSNINLKNLNNIDNINKNIEKVSIKSSNNINLKSYKRSVQNHVTVKTGDTLYSIAKKYNISIEELKTLNHIKDNTARIGTTLVVKTKTVEKTHPHALITKTAIEYIVKKGDTAYGIAHKFGVTYSDLKLRSGEHITPGQHIEIQGL